MTSRHHCVPEIVLVAALLACRQLHAAGNDPVHLGGFADVEWHTSSSGDREGLDVAEIDGFGTCQLSNSWSALGEAVVQRNWVPHGEKSFDADVERLYLAYNKTDALRVEIGQTATGVIRWSEREHRSRFLETPIDVPAIARRPEQDGAFPLRFLGAVASGRVPGSLGIAWSAGAGLGPGRERDETSILNPGSAPAAVLSLSVSPDQYPGLELAAAEYIGEVSIDRSTMHERDATISANYVANGYEFRSEWARMSHRFASSSSAFVTNGYYALFSKRLTGRLERFRPYLLLDHLNVANGESYLSEATDENAWATGLRFDLTQRVTMKAEYRSQRSIEGKRESVAGVQFGLSF